MKTKGKIMKYRYSLSVLALLLGTGATQAQDFMSALRPTSKSYQQLAVFDVSPASMPLEKVEKAVLSAIQVYASQARADRKLMPNSLPNMPGALTFEEMKLPFGLSIQMPKCNGAVDVINSADTDMAQYGDVTQAMACIFPYKDGYRVHYYAKFSESSGGSALQIGAALGKMFTRATGIGDSTQFIGATITNIQEKLGAAGATVKLVGLQPAIEGKTVEKDDLADQAVASQQQQQARGNAIDARKELSTIGLNPNSYDDFIAAVQRGDKLAVKLFIQADSVDLNQPDKDGKRPIQLARRKEVIDMLTAAGAG
jgi:hypothetical protein